MSVHMQIHIGEPLNEKLTQLARHNRRSKRMEVMAALDDYVRRHDTNGQREQDEHDVRTESA